MEIYTDMLDIEHFGTGWLRDMKILMRFTALLLSEGRLNILSFRDLRLHEKRELIYIEEGEVLPVVSDADTTGVPT